MRIRLRRIFLPVCFCLAAACFVELPMAGTGVFSDGAALWDTLFRSLIASPVLYFCFYREDAVFRGEERWDVREAFLAFSLGVGAALSAHGLLFALQWDGRAQEGLLEGPLWLRLFVLLLAAPLLEELFFRGVLYGRLKELFPVRAACVLSAAFFGLYHAEPVQSVYGFFMGLLLCFLTERTQTVKAPLLAHCGANLVGIAVQYGWIAGFF